MKKILFFTIMLGLLLVMACTEEDGTPGRDKIKGEGEMCGGIAGFMCEEGLTCRMEGNYPDAAGTCVRNTGATRGEINYSCTNDSECTVKNVGNCCGYYPACVNVNSETFPDQVKANCMKTGRVSVCGFPSIEACACVEGRCEAK